MTLLGITAIFRRRLWLAAGDKSWQAAAHMSYRNLVTAVCALAVVLLAVGCGKTDSPSPGAAGSVAATDGATSFMKLHWIGKKQLAASNAATNFLALWNFPESAKLEAQTLEKLASAPWRLWTTNTPVSNAPTALLQTLLADLVNEGFYLEARGQTNQTLEVLLAVKLPADRATTWESNAPMVFPSVLEQTGLKAALHRSGDWTLLAVGVAPDRSAGLLAAGLDRIAKAKTPGSVTSSNHWWAAEFDLTRLNQSLALNWKLPAHLPRVTVAVNGDEAGVRTVGDLSFATPLNTNLTPWNIPTNIIYDPLVSFTGVRGVAPVLRAWLGWPEQKLGAAPDQVFFWAQSPALWQHFVTYPVTQGANHVQVIGDYVLDELNPIFLTNKVGNFAWATNAHRLVWKGLPFFQPMLEHVTFKQTEFAVFGLFANNATNRPVPAGLFAEFQHKPNLVYYDWELTEPQVRSWTQMGQLSRMVFGRAQLSPQSASLPWLRAVSTRLGNVTTVATLESPQKISFKRSSVCGFTGPELHLLVEWLESPKFPVGLHTLLLARKPVQSPPSGTNAPPVAPSTP